MTLPSGARLGPYEILAPLGAGGMGEVYRARDTRLAREVAVKVLPESLASDAERLKRFEKEAKSASALNHPNIVTIHDIGQEKRVSYIAMELVEGSTLRELLAGGALPIKKLLHIAPQIAEGLSRAHEAGIVHRDLKPENVMVKKDGLVKILDFGLAKLSSTGSGSDEASKLPTMTGTTPGVVVGTVGYMSPEQASGQALDFRSDQFSLGSILYEMATGKRAFQRKTPIDTLAAILNEEPEPVAASAPQTPAPLRWIVERCLHKEPRQRYSATDDLARDLISLRDHLTEATSGVVASVERPRVSRRARLVAVVAAVALIGVGLAAQRWLTSRDSATSVPTVHRLTFRRGNMINARFAPDGRTVVYTAAWDGKPPEVFAVRTDSPESRPIGLPLAEVYSVSSKGELAVLLRKDGLAWGFGTLARLPIGGGTPREILEDVDSADWAPNGEDLAVVRRGPSGEGQLQYPIGKTLAEGDIAEVRVSPSGDLVAYQDGATLRTVDRSGAKRIVSQGWAGFLWFAWSHRKDELILLGSRTSETHAAVYAISLAGRERILVNLAFGFNLRDVAADGRLLVEYSNAVVAVATHRRGDSMERNFEGRDADLADISDDGQFFLYRDHESPDRVFLGRMDGTPAVSLGSGAAHALSADGKWTLFRKGPRELELVPNGPGIAKRIRIDGAEVQGAEFLPAGKGFLLYCRGKDESTYDLFSVGPDGGKAIAIRAEGYVSDRTLAVSPSGDRIAYTTREGVLRIARLDGGESPRNPGLTLGPNDTVTQWSDDGRYLYLFTPGGSGSTAQVDRLDLDTGRREPWKKLMPGDPTGVQGVSPLRISRDGQSYAYGYTRILYSDLYEMEGLKY